MIVFLLIVIVAILLFGASTVLGAAQVAFAIVCLAIVGLVFWSAGFLGALMLIGIMGVAIAVKVGSARAEQRNRNERVEFARKRIRDEDLERERTAHIREAIEQDRRLNAEFQAKLERERQARR